MVWPITLDPEAIIALLGSFWGAGALVGAVVALLSSVYRR